MKKVLSFFSYFLFSSFFISPSLLTSHFFSPSKEKSLKVNQFFLFLGRLKKKILFFETIMHVFNGRKWMNF